ncbi:hypothetical protein [Micromonospora sp.]|uniref:hypothetical protein n=1 Tax=Micromonospora sp. TaxID=1876 RepID=UPI003B3A92A0
MIVGLTIYGSIAGGGANLGLGLVFGVAIITVIVSCLHILYALRTRDQGPTLDDF